MKIQGIQMTTSTTLPTCASTFLPAGTYQGVWGGCEITLPDHPGIVIATELGVRGADYAVTVTVTETGVTFEQL